MTLKKCILTANDCYKKSTRIKNSKPTGIVVHSTGADNPYIKRYVQPLKSDKEYNTIIKDIGENKYNNHWNKSGGNTCVHAFIGKTANGNIATYQTLPFDYCCWGCASGNKGSYNSNPNARIQFEICEDGLNDAKYFNEAYTEAVEFCVYICKEFGISSDRICSHKEAHSAGYASNHGDPDHWLAKFGKTMKDFRSDAEKKLIAVSDIKSNNSIDTPVKNVTNISSQNTFNQNSMSYRVKVTAAVLNIRKGPSTDYTVTGTIKDKGIYTIVAESDGAGSSKWGKLKSGAGWISLDYCKKE